MPHAGPRLTWCGPSGAFRLAHEDELAAHCAESRQALAWLAALQPLTGHGELLFPAMTDHSKPMSENTLSYAMGRMGYQGTATPHGFRALASTTLNEEGFDPDVIERQLAHAQRNKVRAAYHRAEYLDERRKMMQWWANLVDV